MDYLKISEVDTVQECDKCGDFFPVPAQIEIGSVALVHRKNCFGIKNGVHECLKCGKKLEVSSKDKVPGRLHLHRVDCELYFRKNLLNDLSRTARQELRTMGEAGDPERRATLEKAIAQYSHKLENKKAAEKLRQEVVAMFEREDEAEKERVWEAEQGQPRSDFRPLHIEIIDGKERLFTDTPTEFRDAGWEWIEDNKWRKAGFLPDKTPGWLTPDGTAVPARTPVWIECPSTSDGKGPNPNDYFTMYYLREVQLGRRKKTPEWQRTVERESRRRKKPSEPNTTI